MSLGRYLSEGLGFMLVSKSSLMMDFVIEATNHSVLLLLVEAWVSGISAVLDPAVGLAVMAMLAIPHQWFVVGHELVLNLPTRPAVILEARHFATEIRTLPNLTRSAQSVL